METFLDYYKKDVGSLHYLQYGFAKLEMIIAEHDKVLGDNLIDDWQQIVDKQVAALVEKRDELKASIKKVREQNETLLSKSTGLTLEQPEFNKFRTEEKEIVRSHRERLQDLVETNQLLNKVEDLGSLKAAFILDLETVFLNLSTDHQKAVELIFRETAPIKDIDSLNRPVTKGHLMARTGLNEKELATILLPFAAEGLGVFKIVARPTESSALDGIGDLNEPEEYKAYLADYILEPLDGFQLEEWPRYLNWSNHENWGYEKLKELNQIYEKRDVEEPFNEIRGLRLSTFIEWHADYGRAELWASRFSALKYKECLKFLEGNILQNKKEEDDKLRAIVAKQRERKRWFRIFQIFAAVCGILAIAAIFLKVDADKQREEADKNRLRADSTKSEVQTLLTQSREDIDEIQDLMVSNLRSMHSLKDKTEESKRNADSARAKEKLALRNAIIARNNALRARDNALRAKNSANIIRDKNRVANILARMKDSRSHFNSLESELSGISFKNGTDHASAVNTVKKAIVGLEAVNDSVERWNADPEYMELLKKVPGEFKTSKPLWNKKLLNAMLFAEATDKEEHELVKRLSAAQCDQLLSTQNTDDVLVINGTTGGIMTGPTWEYQHQFGQVQSVNVIDGGFVISTGNGKVILLNSDGTRKEFDISESGVYADELGDDIIAVSTVGEIKHLNTDGNVLNEFKSTKKYASCKLHGDRVFLGNFSSGIEVRQLGQLNVLFSETTLNNSNRRVLVIEELGKKIKSPMLIGDSKGGLFVWNGESTEKAKMLNSPHTGEIVKVEVNGEYVFILSKGPSPKLTISRLNALQLGESDFITLKPHNLSVRSFTHFKDNTMLSCDSKECRTWELSPVQLILKYKAI
jgi:uncharacterized coiled-coil DUF342 family protein